LNRAFANGTYPRQYHWRAYVTRPKEMKDRVRLVQILHRRAGCIPKGPRRVRANAVSRCKSPNPGRATRALAERHYVMRTIGFFLAMMLAVNLILSATSAESAACVRELPVKRTEHWSYRLVKGQRCWYPDSERATIGRIKAERTELADRSSRSKSRLSRHQSAPAESEPLAADVFAEFGSVRVTASPLVSLQQSPYTGFEKHSYPTGAFAEAWIDRVSPVDLFDRVPVPTSRFVRAEPTKAEPSHLPFEPLRSPPSATASSDKFIGTTLWIALGVCLIVIAVFGARPWKTLYQGCNRLLFQVDTEQPAVKDVRQRISEAKRRVERCIARSYLRVVSAARENRAWQDSSN
jgi:hypothetical protein